MDVSFRMFKLQAKQAGYSDMDDMNSETAIMEGGLYLIILSYS